MKQKKAGKRLYLAKRSIANLDALKQHTIAGGGTGKTDRTIADPITKMSLVKIAGCATDTSCGLYVCNGTGPIPFL
jgi:hypothetical protein